MATNPPRVVWAPLKGSQTLALTCPAHMVLYHGSRGPGKTDVQLMRFRRFVGQGYGKFWRGVIFDREYKNLDDLVSKSMRWFPEFRDGAKFLSSKADYRWIWPTGEELFFRAVKKDSDYWGYHGQEFPFIGWNELTKYPTDELFDMMMSCNRSSFRPQDYPIKNKDGTETLIPEIPLQVFATCNPFGAGHNWVKKRFIRAAKPGEIVKKTVNIFNPRNQTQEDVVKTQTHLFGSYRENIYLSPEYVAELEGISDSNKRRAWLCGDWDVVAGGMFDGDWDPRWNIVEQFDIPASWKIDRSFDWGSSAPFSVGWWAESDGSDIQLSNGQWKSTIRGDLFRIAEWYGSSGKANQGLRLLATDVSAGILQRELDMGIHTRVKQGPADNSIWDLVNGNSIAADMGKNVQIMGRIYSGVQWNRSDKSPGSRRKGWDKLRTYMRNASGETHREKAGLFVFRNCTDFIDTVPPLPRDEKDPDDINTAAEDHIADETRYKLLSLGTGTRSGYIEGV